MLGVWIVYLLAHVQKREGEDNPTSKGELDFLYLSPIPMREAALPLVYEECTSAGCITYVMYIPAPIPEGCAHIQSQTVHMIQLLTIANALQRHKASTLQRVLARG